MTFDRVVGGRAKYARERKVVVRRISNVLADNSLLTIVLSSTAAVLLVAGSNLVVPIRG